MYIRTIALSLCFFAQVGIADSLRLIIKFKNPTLTAQAIKTKIEQLTQTNLNSLSPMANGAYTVTLSKKLLKKTNTLQKLKTSHELLYAVEDRKSYFRLVPRINYQVDEQDLSILAHESQWDEFSQPAGIMLESQPFFNDGAWAYTKGQSSKPIVVAVLDTGVSMHESLINNLVKDDEGQVFGWNFSGNNRMLDDETNTYHGTHVAGTIAGYGSIFSGVGEALKILPVKIPGASGMFYESDVINAIYWSVGGAVPGVPQNIYPAKVLNMSFGVDAMPGKEIDYCDGALQEAVFFARQKGAVLIAAAGNDNIWAHMNAPAACNGVVTVASTGPEGLRSYFSNYGPSITLAAPGGDMRYGIKGGILSAVNPGGGYLNSGYDFYQGTSMATPHVAGVAGLIFSVATKKLSPEVVEQILYTTTHEFGKSSDENKSCIGRKPCGHGILNAYNAVLAAQSGFDVYLSTPKFQSTPSVTDKNLAFWHKEADGKALEPLHLEVREDGNIFAISAQGSYRLVQEHFKKCMVIGYDGIGCYKK